MQLCDENGKPDRDVRAGAVVPALGPALVGPGYGVGTLAAAFDNIRSVNREIATAAGRQDEMVAGIFRHIERISQVSDDTAAGSNQTAQASETLARLAEQLHGVVDRFRV